MSIEVPRASAHAGATASLARLSRYGEKGEVVSSGKTEHSPLPRALLAVAATFSIIGSGLLLVSISINVAPDSAPAQIALSIHALLT